MRCVFLLTLCFLCCFPFISQLQKSNLESTFLQNFTQSKNRNLGINEFQRRINSKNQHNKVGLIPLPLELTEMNFDLSFVLMSEHIWYNDYWLGSWNKYKEAYFGYGIDLGLNAVYGYNRYNFIISLNLGLANYYFWTRMAAGCRMRAGRFLPYATIGIGSNSAALAGDGLYFKLDTEIGCSIELTSWVDFKTGLQLAHNLDSEALGTAYDFLNNPYKEKYNFNLLWIPKIGFSFHDFRF